MASVSDEWHLAAAKVSPLIWEVQKAHQWTVERAGGRLRELKKLVRVKDYIGILTSEPELQSVRDRLVIVPVNYPAADWGQPFLVERERPVIVYDWNGDEVFKGELRPAQEADFIRWCAGHFVRVVGLKPPAHGP